MRKKDRPPIRNSKEQGPTEIQAFETLRSIRAMLARSSSFTAIPGWGMVAMGLTALPTMTIAMTQSSPGNWFIVWVIDAAIAATIGGITLARKAGTSGMSLHSSPGRRYVLSLVPSIVAGMLLTGALWNMRVVDIMPALWLLLYGAGTVTGGAYSVRPIPLMGLGFMALGVLALLTPETWGNVLLGIGFGGLHIGTGLVIAKKYGG